MRKSLACVLLFACCLTAQTNLTARQLIDRIRQHVNVAWTEPTVDTFKAGNPDTPVTGIAVTMMATFDVLERAVAEHKNLVITHEPTFYNHEDTTEALQRQSDAVLAQKQQFIREHNLVVWRFHDYWHRRNPDGILLGMTRALGWENFQSSQDPNLFSVPSESLSKLASKMKEALQIRVVRIVGNPEMQATKIAMLPGAAG